MRAYVFTVKAGDACLDGHFPGAPIVPGVVVIDHLMRAAAREYGGRIERIVRCKFACALYPAQVCTIELAAAAADRLRFVCHSPEGRVAHGLLEWRPTEHG